MTASFPSAARVVILLAALLAGACQSTVQVVDQLPSFVGREQLRSTIWLGLTQDRKNISSMASAIIVGPNVLLTNAHVWAAKEPDTEWWQAEIPAERTVFLRNPRPMLQTRIEPGQPPRQVLKPLTRRKFRLLASGTQGLTLPADSDQAPRDLWARDWALIETERPTWKAEDAAIFYADSLDPDWEPRPRTNVLIAGYSSLFLEGESVNKEESPETNLLDLAAFLTSGPYVLRGDTKMIEGQPAVTYQAGWPRPGGHSGGGVYLLNADTQRPELIGVFHSHVPVQTAFRFFGMTMSSSRRWHLCYAPLGEFLTALHKHGVLPRNRLPGRLSGRSSAPDASASPELSSLSR